ncbi:MAG: SGNH/GDSL hydrolase family protein, partial [Muribaculaceae bacterium]|nr:SGNH/GDSL hydrolase family protein [Muribaculaceae bacterium]
RMKETMPKAVWNLSRNSAGLSIRFLTTSEKIIVKYVLAHKGKWLNMAPLNHSGVDLYSRDVHGTQHWVGNHMSWNFGDTVTITYTNLKPRTFAHRGYEYELYLPPYNTVKSLEIGVDEGSKFRFLHESAERPIMIYGSSIVQGASPSRPGLMWTSQVKRDLDYPVVNLGFSGSAYMEPALFEAMGEIPARAYVLDPMPNSYKMGEEILNRMVEGVKDLRTKNQAPILLIESAGPGDSIMRDDLHKQYRESDVWLRKAYDELKAAGVDSLYYLSYKEIGMDEDSYIEGVHPNDIGNRLYAQAVERKLREMLSEDAANHRFPPIRQRRDGSYTWWERHNDVIKLNHTTDPQVLCIGNSITHFWGGEPVSRCNGGDTWKKTWGKRRVVNMGFGWDRIENVFWRINHGELEGCSPEEIYLLIGINNLLAGDSEEDVARGIVDLTAAIKSRHPQAVG